MINLIIVFVIGIIAGFFLGITLGAAFMSAYLNWLNSGSEGDVWDAEGQAPTVQDVEVVREMFAP